jgi:two-component system CheB/CheR fusion protein
MPRSKKDNVKILSSNLFPVIGVGASAGGLDAFKKLLKAIPQDSGMAFILVQHLDPAHESILADLLQKVTKIPVQEITDNIQVEADHIYIIPSNKLLTATDGILQLSDRLPKNQRNLPIDIFFSSLAEVHRNHAVGVVLSGTASDGTLGLKAIKDHGGVTFAQDQESAAYDGMPQSAIDAGVVDFILAPEKIPAQLIKMHNAPAADPGNEEGDTEKVAEDAFRQIIAMIHRRKGVDFTYYKQPTIRRRIIRRIALSMKANIGEYLLYLKDTKSEQDILYQDLLIPVTQFFRDPKVFEQLTHSIFPALLKDRPGNDPIRIWVPGCSTGEEAYSIVMCFQEYVLAQSINVTLQVFATDISEIAIVKARGGLYSKNDIVGLSATRLQQYFTRTDGKFRLNKAIRDACIFAHHNYLKDPPFAKMDLISCRNSLIYLEPFLQKKALTTFHYALREKGFLILGKSETTGQATELYHTFDKVNRYYTRKAVKGNFLHILGDRKEDISRKKLNGNGQKEVIKDDFQKSGDDLLLTKYAPPGVIVNEAMDIVQFRGATGNWLESSSGKPSLNVLKMAREGLAFELRSALHKVKKSGVGLIKENIPIRFDEKDRLVTLEVVPLPDTIEQYYLVLFRDASMLSADNGKSDALDPKAKRTTGHAKEIIRNELLQKELAHVREDMRSVTEDQEAANEELQSANEELLSGSEELQSVNEELETSKEEVQTSNEELIIVNQELYDRNEQLNLSRLYAESIVTTIREPLIVLNKNLEIKSANKAFHAKFQITAEEMEGKPLFELSGKQWDVPGLREIFSKILPDNENIIDYEITLNLRESGERILLLNASTIFRDNSEEQLILLAIEDLTEKRKAEKAFHLFAEELEKQVTERTFSLHEANLELKHSNKNLEQFAYIASHDLQEPLRKIRTFSSVLQTKHKDDLPDKVRDLVTKIEYSAERMSTLIKEVLNFSKILHGDEPFKKTNLNDILDEVLNDFDLLISEKQAVIHHGRLPIIDAIPLQISQLFYNLISNSLKFTKKGTLPRIGITSKMLERKDFEKYSNLNPKLAYHEISISDNGIGFDPKYAEQIFLIFHRLHAREHYSGTGIGLALCKTIVVNHNGEIFATSNKNEGALFQIILPESQE